MVEQFIGDPIRLEEAWKPGLLSNATMINYAIVIAKTINHLSCINMQ
jgi:hypothetical protein